MSGRARMRIPYTESFPPPTIIPTSAKTISGAVTALERFLGAPAPRGQPRSAVVLSGAGLSVASGLADYRGNAGTYRINKTYRPIYYHEFLSSHEARKRYWARSFLGWAMTDGARPNAGHEALRQLGALGLIQSVVTQNVDSFHHIAHPSIPTCELHGYLRATVCTSCFHEYPRRDFQKRLASLNSAWATFLADAVASGALESDDPALRRAKGVRWNPDGDVDMPGAPYTTFRYPPCPRCLAHPPLQRDGKKSDGAIVEVDQDGAWKVGSRAGILKPAVIMFGESIPHQSKIEAEQAIDSAGKLLVLGTSLATYSALRLVQRAKQRGMPISIINLGGVRDEFAWQSNLDPHQSGEQGVRVDMSAETVLPALVTSLQKKSTTHVM